MRIKQLPFVRLSHEQLRFNITKLVLSITEYFLKTYCDGLAVSIVSVISEIREGGKKLGEHADKVVVR